MDTGAMDRASLYGTLTGKSSLEGSLSIGTKSESPEYEGPYTVTPSASDDINLLTADRHVSRNISVIKIPRYETSNHGGGYTFIIAED